MNGQSEKDGGEEETNSNNNNNNKQVKLWKCVCVWGGG